MSRKYTHGGRESNSAGRGPDYSEAFRDAPPANDAPPASARCALDVFEGRRVPRVFIRGDWYFPARVMGRLIEQEDDGKQFVRNVTEDGAEGVDYFRATIEEQAFVREALLRTEGGQFPPSQNHSAFGDGSGRSMVLLSESGVYLALLRSRKAIGKRMRVWLAREVIPSIRRTGAYAAPRAVGPAAVGTNGHVIVGEHFALTRFIQPLRYAAGLLSAARRKSFNSAYRSLRNYFERETRYGRRGQKLAAFPADPTRVSDALATIERLVQDAEREHRVWVDARPSRQVPLFAA